MSQLQRFVRCNGHNGKVDPKMIHESLLNKPVSCPLVPALQLSQLLQRRAAT